MACTACVVLQLAELSLPLCSCYSLLLQSYYGSVATAYGAPFRMTNCKLTNNISPWAALYLSNLPIALFENSVWRNNSGYQAGALTAFAELDTASEFEFRNCRFEANHASQQGGAVWSKGANVTFLNSSCVGNSALVGGCLHATGVRDNLPVHVVFKGCQLLDNSAQQSAGAVWFDTVASAVIQDTKVLYSTAKLSAGALYFHDSSGSLTNVKVLRNAAQSAGAIMLEGAGTQLTVKDTSMVNNEVGNTVCSVNHTALA
jgi:hypothetical protein